MTKKTIILGILPWDCAALAQVQEQSWPPPAQNVRFGSTCRNDICRGDIATTKTLNTL